ncbi:unnamed protein product [Eruca vesicaria subsp. sativa]|uniref:Uncharacterized protein n=1 Tax=Eruca vesicaria subsp. sativa TaxID=29727 RepID=A0ABC8KSX2_ERUVS|nr:unnamed protein product [Eruca vesicaria subsp. sativa]
MEETITTSETVSTQNEIVIEELQGMLKQGLHIKSGEPENAHAGPSVNLEEDMNKKKKKNRQKKKSRVVEDKAEPYVCSICSVICDSPAIFESHLNGRKHADMIDKYSEALLDDKQIQEDIIIQDNGHSIDGEAPENMDYFNKHSRAFEDVIENGYKSIPNEDKAEPEAYVCSVCSVICVCPIVFESHLMGRRHASRVKKHEEVLFDDKKILEESLKEKDHPRNKQESIKEVSQRSKEGVENEIEQEPKKARERLDSVVKRFELSLEDTSEQTVVEAGSASELAEESGTQIRVCDWCSVMCTSQMDFDSHLTGKKHAASVKKQVAVVKKQAGTKFAFVRKNGP